MGLMNKLWTTARVFGLASLLMSPNSSAQSMKINATVAENDVEWIADGVTEHRLDVYGDTQDYSSEKIGGVQWNLVSVPGITLARSALPDSEDFFEGFQMQIGLNYVTSLTDNTRMTNNFGTSGGPNNKLAKLGSYWFTADSSAVTPINSDIQFEFDYAQFSTPAAVRYSTDEGTLTTNTSTIPGRSTRFKVYPFTVGDVNRDRAVDVVDLLYFVDSFGSVAGEANYDYKADFNNDSSVDVVDLLGLVENWGYQPAN